MKNIYLVLTIILIFLMLILPVFAIGGNAKTEPSPTPALDSEKGKVVLFDASLNKTVSLDIEDYLVGVLTACAFSASS